MYCWFVCFCFCFLISERYSISFFHSPGSIVVDFLVQLKQPSGDISFKNGAVAVKLEDGSVTEVTSLIKDAITAEVNMDMDDDMTMVKGESNTGPAGIA